MAVEIIEYRGYHLEVTSQGSGWKVIIREPGTVFAVGTIPFDLDPANRDRITLEAKAIVDSELEKRGL